MTDKKAFYSEHIPQNEYRRIDSKERLKDRQKFDTDLQKLQISDKALKQDLVEKIKEEHRHLLGALLPQSIMKSLDETVYLNPILDRLGLL